MSWTTVNNPLEKFQQFGESSEGSPTSQNFELQVWEQQASAPGARWHHIVNDLQSLQRECELRIIFAPLDYPDSYTVADFTDLYTTLGIPPGFADERTQSVSHSFGTQTDSRGFHLWFHFLCKNIKVTKTAEGDDSPPVIINHQASDLQRPDLGRNAQAPILPQDDSSYSRSGFFLRKSPRGTTLVVFGNTQATTRLLEFTKCAGAWEDASIEPCIFLDLILEGLFIEVDENKILTIAGMLHIHSEAIPFVGLHNIAKHSFHLREALDSSILLINRAIELVEGGGSSRVQIGNYDAQQQQVACRKIRKPLLDRLKYRRSLFESTSLRLNSLDKRIRSAINLGFNIVTQRDSMVMIQDSAVMKRDSKTMKLIAAVTLLFLPATAVASVMGSQLFLARDVDGTWIVDPSPLFPAFWYVAVPFTVVGIVAAASWQWVVYNDGHPGQAGGSKRVLGKGLSRLRHPFRLDTTPTLPV
ncbi:hypothetical protein GQ53DRAFT_873059 [Thozetella sp. PMI_491]|nr:hypothetical protein GQ53DRAFT_873059 [Thozetella sp. PMI_491]